MYYIAKTKNHPFSLNIFVALKLITYGLVSVALWLPQSATELPTKLDPLDPIPDNK